MNAQLEAKLKTLPRNPGVYFHKDAAGEIIYVGKAAVLRNRVRQYFQDSRDKDIKTQALVAEIFDTDWVETESEIDALFLESEMVKRYMPRYNILLRDDKSQMFVRIDMKSEWPTVSFTRNPADDNADYYGPFYNSYALKKALRYLRKVFPYFTREPKPGQSRLDEDLGLSPRREDGSEAYKANLRKLVSYIKGNRKQLANEIEQEMKTAAGLHEFERAAHLRNKLGHMRELQRRVMFGDREFLDISKDKALVDIKLLLGLDKLPTRIEGYDISHMGGTNVVASMVVFTNGVSDRAEYRKFKAKLQQNDDYANMYDTLLRRLSPKNITAWGMPDLLLIDGGKGQLESAIKALDERGVTVPVISIAKREEEMIVHRTRSCIDATYLDGLAHAAQEGIDVQQSGEFYVVNLHPGQRNAGSHSRNLRAGTQVYPHTDVVKLFQRIRDESHRFAVSYHTVLRKQKQTESILEDIPGIGPATRKKLIKTFGSLRAVKAAPEAEVAALVGQAKATEIKKFL
ncbi:excinuclease ABC subunit UvrC [Candidatus Mycosynbacter amalyticus]|uniref:Excinuclease ABC subunit UvrC n=1 Tax=Candidatus Mycosynbacter amalyticus TaxID=2665156 RepID=A0A857MP50_9BACT|nr:excinuclease ABC subunit UvrC [Candidatus Mycosynbacter amalyticus]QHN43029.1 excinuclease ABC subunit UvrC [Candidatus Mycosynbacter amalyticus]